MGVCEYTVSALGVENCCYPNGKIVFDTGGFNVQIIRVSPTDSKTKRRRKPVGEYLRAHLQDPSGNAWSNEIGMVFVVKIWNQSTKYVKNLLFNGESFGYDVVAGFEQRINELDIIKLKKKSFWT